MLYRAIFAQQIFGTQLNNMIAVGDVARINAAVVVVQVLGCRCVTLCARVVRAHQAVSIAAVQACRDGRVTVNVLSAGAVAIVEAPEIYHKVVQVIWLKAP